MASSVKFSNNAVSTLASGVTNVATSLTVGTGDGSKYPSLGAGEYFYCTLANTGETTREVVKVTARSGDVFTITRAQEGTTAATFSTGDKVELRPTAQGLVDLVNTSLSNSPSLGGNVVVADNSSSAALRINQLGSGNALVVEDSTNPDSTPFVVDANGNVAVGNSTAFRPLSVYATGETSNFDRYSNDAFGAYTRIRKSRASAINTQGVVSNNDNLGGFLLQASDGTSFVTAAEIKAEVDGTPGTNDMPGRLVFSTTADGASSPTERYRISNDGTFTYTGKFALMAFDTGTQYAGTTLRHTGDSSAAKKTSFVDSQNNLSITDSHIFFDHNTDGSSSIILGATPAGSRSVDRRATRLAIDGNGATAFYGDVTFDSNLTGSTGSVLKVSTMTIGNGRIEQYVTDADDTAVTVNYQGYNGASTRYRSFTVYDGKGNTILAMTGSTKASVFSGSVALTDNQLSRAMLKDTAYVYVDKGNSGTTTQTLDYTAGSNQKITATGNHTIATSNWAPTGNLAEILLELVNGGAYTITWPTINWIKPDGTTTTSITTYLAANTGRTALQSSGTDFIILWTRDAGTTIYGKLI